MRIITTLLFFTLAAGVADAQSAREHILLGDRAYEAMEARSALRHFEEALGVDPRNYEALWKASRSAVDIGSGPVEASSGRTLFTSAERYARRAVAVEPGDAEGYFSLSRALGKTALTQSARGRVRFATEIRASALECLRIKPDHAGCLHVMGMWNAEIMRLNSLTRMIAKNILGGRVFGTASWKEAIRYMRASVAAEPVRIVHRVDLGEIYSDTGDKVAARAEFETALRLPATDVNDPGYKAQARVWLDSNRAP
ncbi:MAG: tetratricopeptide repeat protein [Gemmatimonadaceae bacterium]